MERDLRGRISVKIADSEKRGVMQEPGHQGERGQAAVETALVLPLMVFLLLAVLQMSLAFQARLLNEYAAFKVARSASVYRLECRRMVRAGLMALIPSLSRTGQGTLQERFSATARKVLVDNTPPGAGVDIPQVHVDYWVSGDARRPFDAQLEPDQQPLKVHVRLVYFYEYRIPLVGWFISRIWLASQLGQSLTMETNPLTPVRGYTQAGGKPADPSPDWMVAQRAMARKYYTVPVVSTWSMRMMSDPLPDQELRGWCE